jgi:hypothetical protein
VQVVLMTAVVVMVVVVSWAVRLTGGRCRSGIAVHGRAARLATARCRRVAMMMMVTVAVRRRAVHRGHAACGHRTAAVHAAVVTVVVACGRSSDGGAVSTVAERAVGVLNARGWSHVVAATPAAVCCARL